MMPNPARGAPTPCAARVLPGRAHSDVERGLVDTDRGPVVDRVYNEKVRR